MSGGFTSQIMHEQAMNPAKRQIDLLLPFPTVLQSVYM